MYINLVSRKDRRETMNSQLQSLQSILWKCWQVFPPTIEKITQLYLENFLSKKNYLQVLKNNKNCINKGSLGCFISHLELLSQSHSFQKIIIILEDDVCLYPRFETVILETLNSLKDFDMIYLEQPLLHWKETAIDFNPYVYKISQGYFGTFGYIIHPKHAFYLLSHLTHIENHIDNMYLTLNQNKDIYLIKEKILSTDISLNRDSNVMISKKKWKPLIRLPTHLFFYSSAPSELIERWKTYFPHFDIHILTTTDNSYAKEGIYILSYIFPKINLLDILYDISKIQLENNMIFTKSLSELGQEFIVYNSILDLFFEMKMV